VKEILEKNHVTISTRSQNIERGINHDRVKFTNDLIGFIKLHDECYIKNEQKQFLESLRKSGSEIQDNELYQIARILEAKGQEINNEITNNEITNNEITNNEITDKINKLKEDKNNPDILDQFLRSSEDILNFSCVTAISVIALPIDLLCCESNEDSKKPKSTIQRGDSSDEWKNFFCCFGSR